MADWLLQHPVSMNSGSESKSFCGCTLLATVKCDIKQLYILRWLAWDPTCLHLSPSFPIKKHQNFKFLKHRKQYYSLLIGNNPAFKGLRVKTHDRQTFEATFDFKTIVESASDAYNGLTNLNLRGWFAHYTALTCIFKHQETCIGKCITVLCRILP